MKNRPNQIALMGVMTASAMSGGFFHVNHHAALDFAVAHFLEYVVGFFQRAGLHHGRHQPFGAELEGFFQVFARAHQRADNLDAILRDRKSVV